MSRSSAATGALDESGRVRPLLDRRQKKLGGLPAHLLDPDFQLNPLLALLADRGWAHHGSYIDRLPGAHQGRPRFEALIEDARQQLFDAVLFWRLSCFAVSIRQAILTLEELHRLGIDFVSYRDELDSSGCWGAAKLDVVAALVELERSSARERILSGLHNARRYGTRSGRPSGRPPRIVNPQQVLHLRESGHSLRQIAEQLGVGMGTVTRSLALVPTNGTRPDRRELRRRRSNWS